MKREPALKIAPTPAVIHAAELRVTQSAQNVHDGLQRLRTVFRTTVARPSTMVKVAGATGLFCFWLASRLRSKSPGKSLRDVAMLSVSSLMLATLLRQGRQRLSTIFR